MNKLYSLLGIGLLSAATLNSCKEGSFVEGEDKSQQEELQSYTTLASIRSYESIEKETSTRANVQDDGRSFVWNTGDKVTIWNGTNGYDFTTAKYDGSEPSNSVEFTGNGTLADGATVWGIYPKKDAPTTANAFTFELGDNATQAADKPELQKTMHMLASGVVKGTEITNLDFNHLTALYQFNITNRKSGSYKVKSVSVSCSTAIFPKTLTVSGEDKTYGEKIKSLTLNLTNLEIGDDVTSSGYMNFFPMPDMTKDTELTFTVTVVKDGDLSATPETIVKKGKISDFYNAESAVAKDGYKYIAGKRYGVSFMLVAELGYEMTAPDNYLVVTEEGLINLMSNTTIMDNAATVITLKNNLDWQSKGTWTPVADFKGTLDGNGKKISNLTLKDQAAGIGLFITNNGIIKNLTLENVRINNTTAAFVGSIAATNKKSILACTINGGTITTNRQTAIGGFVGANDGGSAMISDCKIEGSFQFVVNGGKQDLGGIAGTSRGWIKGSSLGKDVSIVFNQGLPETNIGGIVSWNISGAKIAGCFSLATITLKGAANAGGLTGGNNGAQVIASFAAGSIVASGITGFSAGGLIVSQGTLNGCYSTTILPTSGSNNIGGIAGKNLSPTPTTNTCYYTNGTNAVGTILNTIPGTTKVTIAEFASKISELNSNTEVANSDFEFIVNTGSDKDKVPLLIQKKAGK